MQSITTLIIGADKDKRRRKALEKSSEQAEKTDVLIYDCSENPGIASVRSFLVSLINKPYSGKSSRAIFLGVSDLTIEAQNSLLKTVEEPSESLQVKLTAPNAESIITTLKSRSLTINMEPTKTKISRNFDLLDGTTAADVYNEIDKIQIDDWIFYLRSKLLENLYRKTIDPSLVRKVFNSLQLSLKLKQLEKEYANKRLLKLIIIANNLAMK